MSTSHRFSNSKAQREAILKMVDWKTLLVLEIRRALRETLKEGA